MKGNRKSSGFTLVEVLVASVLSTLVVLGLISSFVQHRRTYKSMQLMTEMDENLRVAVDTISRDLRMANYGMRVRRTDYGKWTSQLGGMTSAVTIVQGAGGASDRITILGAVDSSGGTLANAVTAGVTSIQLTVPSSGVFKFNTSTKRLILVGKTETARITATASGGTTLSINTDPTNSTLRPLTQSYPAGASVELVKAVQYSIKNPTSYPGVPYLHRSDSATTASEEWYNMVSAGIEDLQISSTNNLWLVTLTARSEQEDPNYTDTAKNDHYRRRTITVKVLPRNL